jgi:LmbE family N-acetylglucosaminyl deacetylase
LAEPIRVIAFGAHPDDCEYRMGATAALLAGAGHAVKFVSVTNGDAGHHRVKGPELAARRYAETQEVARRLKVAYDVLDHPDGRLEATLAIREEIIRLIREWRADLVLGPRPNDYHPDHRYTGVLVQDAAYLVVVPNITPDTPALRKNPVFLYYEDRFQRPNPFRPDVTVSIDDVIDKKLAMLDAHTSQVYEWLPWVDGQLDSVPRDPAARKEWLRNQRFRPASGAIRQNLVKWYGNRADSIKYAESFELCEYGRQPSDAEIRQLFPFFGN